EAEAHAIGDAHAAGGSAAIRPDTVIRLLHRELASRPQRVGPDRGADVATHITGLSGEGEPALHLESVDARSQPRGDEADHGIVVHMQHVRSHGLSDLADFFRVRGREHGETVRGYGDFQARFGGRGRVVDDPSREPAGTDNVRVTREAEQPRLAGLHLEPAVRGQHVDHGVRPSPLGPRASGAERDHSDEERVAYDVHVRVGARSRINPCSKGTGWMPNTDSMAFAGVALPSNSICSWSLVSGAAAPSRSNARAAARARASGRCTSGRGWPAARPMASTNSS